MGGGDWFWPTEPDPDATIRLFMFPYAGGSAPIFEEWRPLFPADVSMQAVQLPGRFNRGSEPRHRDMEPLVEAVAEAFMSELDHRPYALFGHSMGALLAYRLAVRLEEETGAGPVLLGAAGWSPEGFTMPSMELVNLPQPELVDWIVNLGSLPPAAYAPEVLDLTVPPVRADLEICAKYLDDGARVSCPIVSYSGRDDPLHDRSGPGSWAGRTPEFLGNSEFPGGHFFLYDAVLPIAADLTRHLLRAAETAPAWNF
ncbi:thioesterase II family protein [Longispora albida]|uniref:thioesterase II family protein n=1 Tax=Longispora albida TaxID=203523 RepID=UPI00037A7D61|nr:alpha/beta fold hydrolase [Longispora albida]